MSVFKFASGGNLVVETSEDDAYPTKAFAETIDTWTAGTDSGRRRMPRDVGKYVRFRDSSNANSTDWLSFAGNVDSWGYAVKDASGFWNVHVGTFLGEDGNLIDPAPQSSTH